MTLEQQIAAAARELAMRERVYPRFVAAKRMTQDKADHEIAAMRAIVETLRALAAGAGAQSPKGPHHG